MPTADEMNKLWWRSSFKRKAVISHTHVRTEVHTCAEVQNYVDEGLSQAELVQKIAAMQRNFQSRKTAFEQYVKPLKISSGSDNPFKKRFNNNIEVDHDSKENMNVGAERHRNWTNKVKKLCCQDITTA
ncbi:hypothetical protein Tco_0814137 [Tanacetum coccineum]